MLGFNNTSFPFLTLAWLILAAVCVFVIEKVSKVANVKKKKSEAQGKALVTVSKSPPAIKSRGSTGDA